MKQVLIVLSCLVISPALGGFLSGTWYTGGSTFWKPIDYFPYPVKSVIAMKPFGREFWVESTENETYVITYPCQENESCWEISEEIPVDLSDGEYVDYNVSKDGCFNNKFVYPLLHKITMCITSATHAPDATYTVSLALTNDHELWIWDNPWVDPFTVITNMIFSTIAGGLIGILSVIFLAIFIPSKRKGKHR